MYKLFLLSALFICFSVQGFSLTDNDTLKTKKKKKEKIKDGWTFGAVPVVAYDSDLGFKYGGLVNFYNYGKPTTYPEYQQSIYVEISRTTKGSGINQLFFDSEHMFPNRPIRITADLSYLTEQALDFYGFNGYESAYFMDFENDETDDYISRMYYRYERKLLRFTLDFQGRLLGDNLNWLIGFGHFNHELGSVDIDKLNEGKDGDDLLPDTASLYDKYVDWGLIPAKEADGGVMNYLKFGTIYDTRDNEANPMKGIWSEVIIVTAPKLLDNYENSFTKLSLIHRQYFTLIPSKLSFAYRAGYQGTVQGNPPFYYQPYLISSFSPSVLTEGLGGAKSLRGIRRDRIVGEDIVYGNFEFRWKFWKGVIKNQNFYLALSTFLDAGKVTKPIEINKSLIPASENLVNYFDESSDKIHASSGIGLHVVLNQNFIVAFDYGMAFDKRDGDNGLYIGMNFLF